VPERGERLQHLGVLGDRRIGLHEVVGDPDGVDPDVVGRHRHLAQPLRG
jgi:hypothetical protein